ncbi:hypothetical protein NQ315_005813 [Exocentrus adspersus]|uniref:Trichohyalin-plectin-homology domain-containing protein n=1 Tax=Exocentrus adspersus TaxID=1586481 RepID=A0AAV8VS93_9CUCU|nr:hypothetical protein NQ315_005813 [Exocentrus adspersus]
MESRYYLFPGQTFENTKISDRAHALHITNTEWKKILKHLDRKKDLQEILDKEERKKKYISEGNRAMTENWDNTIEKMRKKKDEARAKTTEEIEAEKVQKYYVMKEEQEKLRKEYIENKMFRTSGACNDLNSAFVESEALYEREKQKEFNDFLKKHEREEDEKFAKKFKDDAIKEVEEKKEAARRLFEKKKGYGAELQKTIKERALTEKASREKHILNESKDNILAVEEMERIKKVEEEEKIRQKRELAVEMKKNMEHRMEIERQLKQEEKEMDEVVEIYKEAKHRIECLKKEKEKELQDEIIKRREVVAGLVGAAEISKTEEEEKRIRTAIAERDAIEEAKIKTRAEYDEMMRNQRLEDRQHYLKRREIEQKKEAEIKKWEMLNAYKVDEVTRKYEEEKKKQLWRNILKYRQDLLTQMEETEEEKKRQQRFECSELTNIKQMDAMFLEYAAEILEYAKKRGRPTYSIEKAILEYKKINNLLPRDLMCDDTDETKKNLLNEVIKKSAKSKRCKCTIPKK